MNLVLLLGAGFSRNWGGWLAQEAFEYLLGCPDVDEGIRSLLWVHQRRGGFESALAELQEDHRRRQNDITEANLGKLQGAITRMFDDMNKGFAWANFEFHDESLIQRWPVRGFLIRFDTIFTLNQDLLLERFYMNQNGSWGGRQGGHTLPGMTAVPGTVHDPVVPNLCSMQPSGEPNIVTSPGVQPIVKLHGSCNWIDRGGIPLLVMGGNKSSMIGGHDVLNKYQSYWNQCLSKPNTRLMVIGYGFGDDHINQAISRAADRVEFKIFVVDPLGVNVFDSNRNSIQYAPGELAGKLQSHVIGASRRTLREIFSSDRIENAKVMRFFE